ncbi:NAD-dependent epimerase/dehydratase family protein [Bradyrhizobium sp. A5]|uniref:NAD-dependent epimerase/dehydratase family protein n=1 Tax=Bradyrhizobium sp. A5 TaxID=3133696 RepID=UPI0032523AA7
MKARISILGATGHIGRALADVYAAREGYQLALFSRRPNETAAAYDGLLHVSHHDISNLDLGDADVVVNAVGIGDPAQVPIRGHEIYQLTMEYEDRIESALRGNSGCLTVFISSGAAYGKLDEPARAGAPMVHPVNSIRSGEWYGLSKLAAELRHRSQVSRRVVDVRVFGFLSPHLDLKTKYFMSSVYQALLSGTRFVTDSSDMHRDYIGVDELASIIDGAARQEIVNSAVDTYTIRPAGKFDILERLGQLGLDWRVSEHAAVAQQRVWYSSEWRTAEQFGYSPKRSSLDVVEAVARELMAKR